MKRRRTRRGISTLVPGIRLRDMAIARYGDRASLGFYVGHGTGVVRGERGGAPGAVMSAPGTPPAPWLRPTPPAAGSRPLYSRHADFLEVLAWRADAAAVLPNGIGVFTLVDADRPEAARRPLP